MLAKDSLSVSQRSGSKHQVGRLVRMHSDEMEEITKAGAGDIVALFGIDCSSGDTFADGTVKYSMTSMHVPDGVSYPSIRIRRPK